MIQLDRGVLSTISSAIACACAERKNASLSKPCSVSCVLSARWFRCYQVSECKRTIGYKTTTSAAAAIAMMPRRPLVVCELVHVRDALPDDAVSSAVQLTTTHIHT